MKYSALILNQENRGVLTITLNRPSVRNSFNEVLISELTEIFTHEVTKPEVKVLVLRGDGPVFCAGGDLNWMKKSAEMNFEENLADTRRLSEMFVLMNECPKPLIGVAHGAAIGGGVGLISVCDLVLADENTQFSLSEVRLGIIPACIGPFVIAKIGASQARRYFVSAERFKAQEAMKIGLVHQVFQNEADLNAALESHLSNMLECGPAAIRAAKKMVLDLSWPEKRNAIKDYIDVISRKLSELRISSEGQEGLKAFLEKRKPNWIP